MAITTQTLKDTSIATGRGAAGGLVTVLVNMNANTAADSLILDASALVGHAAGAKLSITRAWWSLVEGTVDNNTGWCAIYFEGDSDIVAINLAGNGHYDGTAGKIKNGVTNTGVTSGDMKLTAYGTSGFVMLELRKESGFTA